MYKKPKMPQHKKAPAKMSEFLQAVYNYPCPAMNRFLGRKPFDYSILNREQNCCCCCQNYPQNPYFLADDRGHRTIQVQCGCGSQTPWSKYFQEKFLFIEDGGCGMNHRPPRLKNLPRAFPLTDPACQCQHFALDGDNYTADSNLTPIQQQCQHGFYNLIKAKPPVVWLMGKPNDIDLEARAKFAKSLAKKLGYIYIDLDSEIRDRAEISSEDQPPVLGMVGDDPIKEAVLARLVMMAWRIIQDTNVTLNHEGVLELLKLAMIQYYDAKGFVIDRFPCSVAEADEFEEAFYPCTFAVYIRPDQDPNTLPITEEEKRVQGHIAQIEKINRKKQEKLAGAMDALDEGEGTSGAETDATTRLIKDNRVKVLYSGGNSSGKRAPPAKTPSKPLPQPPPNSKTSTNAVGEPIEVVEYCRRDDVYSEEKVLKVMEKYKARNRCFKIEYGVDLGKAEVDLIYALVLKRLEKDHIENPCQNPKCDCRAHLCEPGTAKYEHCLEQVGLHLDPNKLDEEDRDTAYVRKRCCPHAKVDQDQDKNKTGQCKADNNIDKTTAENEKDKRRHYGEVAAGSEDFDEFDQNFEKKVEELKELKEEDVPKDKEVEKGPTTTKDVKKEEKEEPIEPVVATAPNNEEENEDNADDEDEGSEDESDESPRAGGDA